MKNVHTINLDTKQRNVILNKGIYLTENDNHFTQFHIYLYDKGEKIEPLGDYAVLFFMLSDGSFYQGNLEIKKDYYSYEIKGKELSVPGIVVVHMKVYDKTGAERLSIQPFQFISKADLESEVFDGIEATDQYEALQEAYALLNRAQLIDRLINGSTYPLQSINPHINTSDVVCFMKCNTVWLSGEIIVNQLNRPLSLFRVPSELRPKRKVKTLALLNTSATQPKAAYVTIDTDGLVILDTFVNTIYSSIILDIRYDIY